MSSMTDIVFLLLIFFMLTSTLVTVNALDILLPKAQGKTENKKSTSVSITKKLDFYVDKKKVKEGEIEKYQWDEAMRVHLSWNPSILQRFDT